MGFDSFLNKWGVLRIDPVLVQVIDESIASLIIASYLQAPAPPVPATTMPNFGENAMIAKTRTPSTPGFNRLLQFLLSDMTSFIYPKLIAGSASLLSPAAIGTAGGPITPSALLNLAPDPNARMFAYAILDWSVSLIPSGDARLISPLYVT